VKRSEDHVHTGVQYLWVNNIRNQVPKIPPLVLLLPRALLLTSLDFVY
jgi:hypothetical protein